MLKRCSEVFCIILQITNDRALFWGLLFRPTDHYCPSTILGYFIYMQSSANLHIDGYVPDETLILALVGMVTNL